ncbi:hypothetical protein FRACYDRAFT_241493 [Fragilariopsis cylindrus CCMP1102]|uniref:Uncharacterized protein n=1 Tax=Fragilariopsis cylindrus CCMP1102 TaxID=635003 RepID=A0A1E7F9X0_9STRA|nr:hypothetical protein FRACYDRAFT_241493 [Fragilariopsis cylindrus CCMP1102]|eukprot:OEU14934.1 hypothetical protein FRACYDRAFT_241493 [Fragilariopsis cylindrus CCMP1102]
MNKSNEKEETIEAAAISADSTAALAYLIFPTVFSDTLDVSLFFLENIWHHMMCNPYDTQYIHRLGDVAVDDSIPQTNPSSLQLSLEIVGCLRKLDLAHLFWSQNTFTTRKIADNMARVDETNLERYSSIRYRSCIVELSRVELTLDVRKRDAFKI